MTKTKTTNFVDLNRKFDTVDFKLDGQEVSIPYCPPGISYTPYMLQWMIEGFLQSLPAEEKEKKEVITPVKKSQLSIAPNDVTSEIKTAFYVEKICHALEKYTDTSRLIEGKTLQVKESSSSDKFEYVILRLNELVSSNQYDFTELIGAAMVGSEASIKYLFPLFKRSFPTLDIFTIRDEVFNECLGRLVNDFFTALLEKVQAGITK